MTDLKNGIIEIEGMVLSRHTKASDFENNSNPNIDVQISKRGHTYVEFKNPIIASGVSMYVNVVCRTDKNVPSIELCPVVPADLQGKYTDISIYKVTLAKQWLKGMEQETPCSESEESILYSYDWGYIRSATRDDPHYGLTGGEIIIRYGE